MNIELKSWLDRFFNSFSEGAAFIQVGPDQFNLLIGPFEKKTININDKMSFEPLLYQPDFWDFLKNNDEPAVEDSSNKNTQIFHVLAAVESKLVTRQQLLSYLDSLQLQPALIEWAEPTESFFKEQFDLSQQKFNTTTLKKTVPFILQSGKTKFSLANLNWVLKNLFKWPNFGWSYGFWSEQQGYIGHTPELICHWLLKEEKIESAALAGTYAKSTSAKQEILQDSKNLQEHEIVVEDIYKKLTGLFSAKQLMKSKTYALELKHLVHLKTDFQVLNTKLTDALNVIKSLHPTAALGLYPAEKKHFQFFSELSLQKNRKTFAAPFAFIQNDFVLCIAAIRSFHFTPNDIKIFSGCGVTAQSDYQTELLELENKRNSVKKMMGLIHD